jgi:hypothetical protein
MKERDEFLDHVRQMIGYWASEEGSNVPAETSKRDALEGLAFSILVALDGGAAVGPYVVSPLDLNGRLQWVARPEGVGLLDIAGELHEVLFPKNG